MRREFHVRFCEGPGVQFPRATRFIVGFQYRTDAERFLEDLRERLRRFSLELHPEKTRLVAFGRFSVPNGRERGLNGKPETFDFLGLTHICGRTRAGRFLLLRQTVRARMQAKLKAVKMELQRRRHLPIPEQGRWLGSVIRGHIAYYAVHGNLDHVGAFRTQVTRSWHRALRRRGQRDRTSWARMSVLATRWLPPARVAHPWPDERFDARTRGKSPVR